MVDKISGEGDRKYEREGIKKFQKGIFPEFRTAIFNLQLFNDLSHFHLATHTSNLVLSLRGRLLFHWDTAKRVSCALFLASRFGYGIISQVRAV